LRGSPRRCIYTVRDILDFRSETSHLAFLISVYPLLDQIETVTFLGKIMEAIRRVKDNRSSLFPDVIVFFALSPRDIVVYLSYDKM